MTEREKALRGEMFKAGDPVLRQERNAAKELCFQLNQCVPMDTEKRAEIIHKLIGTIKGNFDIISPFYCDYGKYITIGNNFFSNYNCKILDGASVTFGDDVRIGPDCTFCTPNHAMQPEMRKDGYMIYKPISVGNNDQRQSVSATDTVCGTAGAECAVSAVVHVCRHCDC